MAAWQELSLKQLQACYQGPDQEPGSDCTTFMLRSVPRHYKRDTLLKDLELCGLMGAFDFLYLPWDKRRRSNITFAFVNFATADIARRCFYVLSGRVWSLSPKSKPCRVARAHVQGLRANLESYLSSLEKDDTQEESSHEPLVYQNQAFVSDVREYCNRLFQASGPPGLAHPDEVAHNEVKRCSLNTVSTEVDSDTKSLVEVGHAPSSKSTRSDSADSERTKAYMYEGGPSPRSHVDVSPTSAASMSFHTLSPVGSFMDFGGFPHSSEPSSPTYAPSRQHCSFRDYSSPSNSNVSKAFGPLTSSLSAHGHGGYSYSHSQRQTGRPAPLTISQRACVLDAYGLSPLPVESRQTRRRPSNASSWNECLSPTMLVSQARAQAQVQFGFESHPNSHSHNHATNLQIPEIVHVESFSF